MKKMPTKSFTSEFVYYSKRPLFFQARNFSRVAFISCYLFAMRNRRTKRQNPTTFVWLFWPPRRQAKSGFFLPKLLLIAVSSHSPHHHPPPPSRVGASAFVCAELAARPQSLSPLTHVCAAVRGSPGSAAAAVPAPRRGDLPIASGPALPHPPLPPRRLQLRYCFRAASASAARCGAVRSGGERRRGGVARVCGKTMAGGVCGGVCGSGPCGCGGRARSSARRPRSAPHRSAAAQRGP